MARKAKEIMDRCAEAEMRTAKTKFYSCLFRQQIGRCCGALDSLICLQLQYFDGLGFG